MQSGFKYIFNVTQINSTVFNILQQLYIFIERITVVCCTTKMNLSVATNDHDSLPKHSTTKLTEAELKILVEKQENITAR